MRHFLICISMLFPFTVHAQDCFDRAGRDYRIDPDLLRAIAFRESSMNPHAMNIVTPQKYAVGEMQIHSQNFPHLAMFGITPQKLYADGCMNIYTGTYYLALAFNRWGVSWDAVGAYNAGFAKNPVQAAKRNKYAEEIHRIYTGIKKSKTAGN